MKLIIEPVDFNHPPFEIEGYPFLHVIKGKIEAHTRIPCSDQILLLNGYRINTQYDLRVDGGGLKVNNGSVIHLRIKGDDDMIVLIIMPAPMFNFDLYVNGNQKIEEIKQLVVQKLEGTPIFLARETGMKLPNYKKVNECGLSQPYEMYVKIVEEENPPAGGGLLQSTVEWIRNAEIDLVHRPDVAAPGGGLLQSTVDWIMNADIDLVDRPRTAGPPKMSYTVRAEDLQDDMSFGEVKREIHDELGYQFPAVIVIKNVETGAEMPDGMKLNSLPTTTKLEVTILFPDQ